MTTFETIVFVLIGIAVGFVGGWSCKPNRRKAK